MGNCCASPYFCRKQNVGPKTSPIVEQIDPFSEKSRKSKSTSSSRKISRVESEISSQVVSMRTFPTDIEDFRLMAGYGHLVPFTYDELIEATKNFRPDHVIGEGGFGFVYKGVIDESVRAGYPRTEVAIKELNQDSLQGDKEWLTEVNYLGNLSHPSLVKLIGYCCEQQNRLLVYEYMPGGSLDKLLFSTRMSSSPPWSLRLKVALATSKGIAFLHGLERPIIYRDLKTSNILLDADFNAKIADFGLAKEGPTGDQSHISTRVMGTYGYAAPEYLRTGHLTPRSDVYGFGVLLLELLIGKRALEKTALEKTRAVREQNLVDWARPLLIRPAKLMKVIDPRLNGQFSKLCAERMGKLTYDCLDANAKARPSMSEAVEILQDLVESCKDDVQIDNVTIYEGNDDTTDR